MDREILNQETEMVPVDEIECHPDNPREGDVQAIAESIEENGFYGSIVVRESTGQILAGNHRYRAAVEVLGFEELPVVWVECGEDRAKKILLADNKTADRGEYDDEALASMLEEISEVEVGDEEESSVSISNFEGTGFEDDELDEIVSSSDAEDSKSDSDNSPVNFSVTWEIYVECESEQEQLELMELLEKEGYECQAMTL